jgi:hypothetical protein
MNVDAVRNTELDASMELEEVFLHFFMRFRDSLSACRI